MCVFYEVRMDELEWDNSEKGTEKRVKTEKVAREK